MSEKDTDSQLSVHCSTTESIDNGDEDKENVEPNSNDDSGRVSHESTGDHTSQSVTDQPSDKSTKSKTHTHSICWIPDTQTLEQLNTERARKSILCLCITLLCLLIGVLEVLTPVEELLDLLVDSVHIGTDQDQQDHSSGRT